MELFLERFDGGKLYRIADEIGARNNVLTDIKQLFSIEYSSLWQEATGTDEIRKLIIEYEVVKQTNLFLNVSAHSKEEAFKAWREELKFIGYSCEAAKTKYPPLEKFYYYLLKIVHQEDMLPEHMKSFLEEMTNHFTEVHDVLDNSLATFCTIYNSYLVGLTDTECEEVKNTISSTTDMFVNSTTQSNAIVRDAVAKYKQGKIKLQMVKIWSEKAEGTKNPKDWSRKMRTPILACVSVIQYGEAKKAFDVLNNNAPSDTEIRNTIDFLKNTNLFDKLSDKAFIDDCFKKNVLHDFAIVLTDINAVRDALEETGVDAYEWQESPVAIGAIANAASMEYNAGGSDRVVEMIQKMKPDELQTWLTDVIKNDMGLGVKILLNGRK